MYAPVLKYIKLCSAVCTLPVSLLSYFKSLPHSTANQGHSIVPSFHKHSPFSFKKKVNMCQSHMASHLQPSDLSPQEKWSRQERMIYGSVLLQAAPAVPWASLTCPCHTRFGIPALSKELHLHKEYSWDAGGPLTQRGQEVHLLLLPICRAENWTREIELALQHHTSDLRCTKPGRSTGCLLSSRREDIRLAPCTKT